MVRVIVEIVILGLANALRPAGLAAVYALLATREPRRLVTMFILAGLPFSTAIGVIVVSVINGADLRHGTSDFDAVVNILAGVAALGFAVGMVQGRLERSPNERSLGPPSAISRRLRDPSLKVAAGAGIATHLPGLFYLVALNQISAQQTDLFEQIVDVLVFNLIWWSVPVASLVFFLMRPVETRRVLAGVNAWGRANQRTIITVLFAAVGLYLTIRGAVNLVG